MRSTLGSESMRRLIDSILSAYLLPLRLSSKLALYVKGKILTYDEHYVVTLDVIRRNFLNSRGIVVDVGAFDGDSTVIFARELPDNKIIGFEPNPIPFKQAKRNCEGYSNVEMVNLGFSDTAGEVDFFLTSNSVSSSLYQIKDFSEIHPDKVIKVNVTTMDKFFEGYQEL